MKASVRARGFSMLEVLVVLGMFAIVAAFGLLVSMETFRGTDFHSDRDLLVSLLQRARAQSISNMCSGTCTDGKSHGVHIDDTAKKYVLFQGGSFVSSDPLNSSFDASPSVTHSSTDVVFAQLSGTTTGYTITMSGNGKSSTITISAEGQITWTN